MRQLNSDPPALSGGQLVPGVEVTWQVHITNRPELLESPPCFISPDSGCEKSALKALRGGVLQGGPGDSPKMAFGGFVIIIQVVQGKGQ